MSIVLWPTKIGAELAKIGDALAAIGLPSAKEAARAYFARNGQPYSAMCGRLRVGKGFLHVCSIGRCSYVFGLLERFT